MSKTLLTGRFLKRAGSLQASPIAPGEYGAKP